MSTKLRKTRVAGIVAAALISAGLSVSPAEAAPLGPVDTANVESRTTYVIGWFGPYSNYYLCDGMREVYAMFGEYPNVCMYSPSGYYGRGSGYYFWIGPV